MFVLLDAMINCQTIRLTFNQQTYQSDWGNVGLNIYLTVSSVKQFSSALRHLTAAALKTPFSYFILLTTECENKRNVINRDRCSRSLSKYRKFFNFLFDYLNFFFISLYLVNGIIGLMYKHVQTKLATQQKFLRNSRNV